VAPKQFSTCCLSLNDSRAAVQCKRDAPPQQGV
jgi:hypothetical protein